MNFRIVLTTALALNGASLAVPIPQPGQPSTRGLSSTQDFITNTLTRATADRDQDPLKFIAKDMGTIVVDLDKLQTDNPVQVKQERVVAELEELIKLLEKACSGSGGGGLNPSSPMADSVLGGGPGGINDLHDPKAGEKEWGRLPDKQREQILQSKTDGFPPGYEAILQSYYRRLAQEQIEDAEKGASNRAPTTAAAP